MELVTYLPSRLPSKEQAGERPKGLFQPWHLRSRSAIHAYLNTLEPEVKGWLLVMFVDNKLNLVGVEAVGRGSIAEVRVDLAAVVKRGHSYAASGFFLVHDHPEGHPEASPRDVATTSTLRQLSGELGMPLVEHCIVFRDKVRTVGGLDEQGNTLPWPTNFIR